MSLSLSSTEHLAAVESILKCNTTPKEAMQEVVDTVIKIFDADRVYLLYPCDPDAPSWRPIESTKIEYPGVTDLVQEIMMDNSVASICEKLLMHKDIVTFGTGGDYPVPDTLIETFDVYSQLSMPLYPPKGKAWNFGVHQCSSARVWSDEEKALFRAIGLKITEALPPRE